MKAPSYIIAHWNKYSKEFEYHARSYAPSMDSGDILLEERELEFDTPNDIVLRQLIVKALTIKKNKVLADAHVESVAIDEEIQEMLAIEDKSDASAVTNVSGDDNIPF